MTLLKLKEALVCPLLSVEADGASLFLWAVLSVLRWAVAAVSSSAQGGWRCPRLGY